MSTTTPYRYFVLNKPFDMVSQFVSPHPVPLLSHLKYSFPEGTHAIGRLDRHSEGLLLLTTNKAITRLLFSGKKHRRIYTIQVKGKVAANDLARLQKGVDIKVNEGLFYNTGPVDVTVISRPEFLEMIPGEIAEGRPCTWLQLRLFEGKYRQVRKMVSAIRHPCRRLVRTAIEDLKLGDLQLKPGEIREFSEEAIMQLLHLR